MTDSSQDFATLWDFDDPRGSEQRFRALAASADVQARPLLLTHVARSLGLQERYDEAHRLLDEVSPGGRGELAVRVALERGRLWNSAGDPDAALPFFRAAADEAAEATLEALEIDALHMVAIASPPSERLALNQDALTRARASQDPTARAWEGSLLNNIGMCHVDAGDLAAALDSFRDALTALLVLGDPGRVRVGRWMVAWVLRLQGRLAEALAIQRELKEELDAAGETDPYVDEELATLETLEGRSPSG